LKIDKTTIAFFLLALLSGAALLVMRGAEPVWDALLVCGSLLVFVAPQIAAGLLIGGLAQHLLSRERAASLFGRQSGMRGLLLATLAGIVTPGGPFTSFPLVLAIWTAGADVGAVICYLVAWALLGLNRMIVWEVPFMGLEFSVLRFVISLPLPFIAGWIGRLIATRIDIRPSDEVAP
jgi:uncharacterized membrane protein YraQ (UPF0718 family)